MCQGSIMPSFMSQVTRSMIRSPARNRFLDTTSETFKYDKPTEAQTIV